MNQKAWLALQDVLASGERLYWADQPVQGIRFRRHDLSLLPFSIFWLGFSLFWEYMAYTMGAPLFFMLFGLPFVLIGLYMIPGRFFDEARRRRKIFYGLSNRRVLILNASGTAQLKYFPLEKLQDYTLNEKEDSRGDIRFGMEPIQHGGRAISLNKLFGSASDCYFDDITNAKQVYEQIGTIRSIAR